MKLVWSRLAIADREKIFEYFLEENPIAAIFCDQEIGEQVDSLLKFPKIGRLGRVEKTRELVIERTPFIVAYIFLNDEIFILRVLHESQMWEKNF